MQFDPLSSFFSFPFQPEPSEPKRAQTENRDFEKHTSERERRERDDEKSFAREPNEEGDTHPYYEIFLGKNSARRNAKRKGRSFQGDEAACFSLPARR